MKKYSVPKEHRPTCIVSGCERKGQHTGKYSPTGFPKFRNRCDYHHKQAYTIREWKWKQHRKTFCENTDGRLGFTCNYEIQDMCQLQTDHIDGDASNNKITNLQTLCASCHAYKTMKYNDNANHNKIHNKSFEEQRKELSTLEEFLV
tara:strand:+ start:14275 stop:14715 length:441 start_codon:yes stop_codon:yes gene_type:complete